LFSEHPLFRDQQLFAAYLAHGGEFELAPLIQKIWQTQKQCYLPVLAAAGTGLLQFVKYQEETLLQTNRYHILEPEFNAREECLAADLNVVLVPLTAFNRQGVRLGSGGGYYDRTFAFKVGQSEAKPFLIGVGFSQQEVEKLPHADWDVKLDGILTEKELLIF
jgi:5-formyltetrahydrofolate cyclo-ligase